MRKSYFFLLFSLSLLLGWSCRPVNESEKMAEVDGVVITRADVDRSVGKEIQSLREKLYHLEQQKLNEYIGATLLTREANERNISVSTLLEQEVKLKVAPVSESDIQIFYEKNKNRIGADLEKVHDQIRDYLLEQRNTQQKHEYLKTLRANAKVMSYLKPPPVYRADVSVSGAPIRGAEKASVTIVKFEDFQCPYCKTVQPTFLELLTRYDGKVKLVHKDLPLEAIHPQARPAAEAARCAGEQGKFWEYHDQLYAKASKLAAENLKDAAKGVGLNVASFEQCVVSGKFKGAVERDFNEAARLGLTGTPAFFINGRALIGAQPIEAFTAIIDEELALAK